MSAPVRPRARLPFRPEVIGDPACPILHRWTLGGDRLMKRAPVKVLLHHFLPNADDRDTHDHPRPFVTMVLRGGYDDLVPCPTCGGTGDALSDPTSTFEQRSIYGPCARCGGPGLVSGDRMRAGMVRYRRPEYAHRTRVGPRGCWTLVLMGPVRRRWGFWREGRWWSFRDYEARFGFGMRCDDGDGDA